MYYLYFRRVSEKRLDYRWRWLLFSGSNQILGRCLRGVGKILSESSSIPPHARKVLFGIISRRAEMWQSYDRKGNLDAGHPCVTHSHEFKACDIDLVAYDEKGRLLVNVECVISSLWPEAAYSHGLRLMRFDAFDASTSISPIER